MQVSLIIIAVRIGIANEYGPICLQPSPAWFKHNMDICAQWIFVYYAYLVGFLTHEYLFFITMITITTQNIKLITTTGTTVPTITVECEFELEENKEVSVVVETFIDITIN